MKKYMDVMVTCCPGSSLHAARVYYSDEEAELELFFQLSYEDGMKELRKLEKRLGRMATIVVNQFDRNIAYKELYGYIDRE